jgi:hypothetical protein
MCSLERSLSFLLENFVLPLASLRAGLPGACHAGYLAQWQWSRTSTASILQRFCCTANDEMMRHAVSSTGGTGIHIVHLFHLGSSLECTKASFLG